MAMRPNWFDFRYEDALQKATAEQAVHIVASDRHVIEAVRNALEMHDQHSGQHGWGGPTRTQAVRTAIAEVLQAQEGDPIYPVS
jgi:hypothetical protein